MALIALKGQRYGYFGATYKLLTEVWQEVTTRLAPVIVSANKSEKRIELATGGVIEFWTLDDPDAGRSRRYHEVGIDEAGLVKHLEAVWFAAIRPTLTDFQGKAWFAGTPKGRNYFAVAFDMGRDPLNKDWSSWQMPTATNPYIPGGEVEEARRTMPDRLFRQEYLAEFLEDAGGVFRGVREVVLQGASSRVPQSRVTLGVDLAKVDDFTVVCGVDDSGNQVYFDRFNQISWERQEEAIVAAWRKFPGSLVRIETNNQGDPMFERLRKRGVNVEGWQTTNATKENAIDNLAMLIEQRRVSLLDIPEQTGELQAYQYELTPSRNVRMSAPSGMHDDTVIALALACWSLRERRPQIGDINAWNF